MRIVRRPSDERRVSLMRNSSEELTFIIHRRIDSLSLDDPGFLAARDEETMIGDINLFLSSLTASDSEDETTSKSTGSISALKAECEIMIASPSARRQGYAIEALRLFLSYSSRELKIPPRNFFARISLRNVGSIALFERLGFVKGKIVEVFDELTIIHLAEEWSWKDEVVEMLDSV